MVHFDMSAASIAIARERAAIRKLDHAIKFVRGNIMRIDEYDLGSALQPGHERFDWIDTVGVLHHLRHPAAGLRRA